MARKSSLNKLPVPVQDAVRKALEEGATIDEVVAQLVALGHSRSRSAVGRYAQHYSRLTEEQRNLRAMTQAMFGANGDSNNPELKLMAQMMTSVGARMVMPMVTGEDEELDSKAWKDIAAGMRSVASAAKIAAETDILEARERGRLEAEERMRQKLEDAGTRGDIDPQALANARRILGLVD